MVGADEVVAFSHDDLSLPDELALPVEVLAGSVTLDVGGKSLSEETAEQSTAGVVSCRSSRLKGGLESRADVRLKELRAAFAEFTAQFFFVFMGCGSVSSAIQNNINSGQPVNVGASAVRNPSHLYDSNINI